jgi:GT2 family glycosyltransferase
MTPPRVSVVVPTYQRSTLLRSCIEAFDRQESSPSFEVVVADDGSTDDTSAVLSQLAETRQWLTWSSLPENRGPAAARNQALSNATGELVVFVDDDVVATSTLLARHVAHHDIAADESLAVLGRVAWHPSLEVSPFMKWLDHSGLQFAYDTWLREGPVEIPPAAFYTANVSLRRDRIDAVGGFDERFPPAYEDLELAVRLADAGLRLDYRPDALAHHNRAIDRATYARRMRTVGTATQLMRAIAPGFAVDDQALRRRRVSAASRLVLAVRAKLDRREESLWNFYWADMAAAYDAGLKRPLDLPDPVSG